MITPAKEQSPTQYQRQGKILLEDSINRISIKKNEGIYKEITMSNLRILRYSKHINQERKLNIEKTNTTNMIYD